MSGECRVNYVCNRPRLFYYCISIQPIMMQLNLNLLKGTLPVMFCTLVFHYSTKAQSAPAVSNNELVLPANVKPINFYWLGDTINGKWEQYTALLLPVRLKNCPKLFYMQFDLGAPSSLFYKNKLMAIQAKYPKAIQLKALEEKLTNFSFTIDKTLLLAKQIAMKQFDSSTVHWADNNSIEIIGTIGADLIDGKVAIIDYPNKQLIFSQTIPADLAAEITLTDFMYVQRRILLPAKIKGKTTILYFDTGSSMYELLTDKKTAQSLAVDERVFQSNVKSWDKYLTANTVATNDSIEINGCKIVLRNATFIEGVSNSQMEQMMKMGIGGMTGNKLFLTYKLILDTMNKKFALVGSR